MALEEEMEVRMNYSLVLTGWLSAAVGLALALSASRCDRPAKPAPVRVPVIRERSVALGARNSKESL